MGPREYRGRPSHGCDLCRKKRVKCDEAKPACARCTKSGIADQCKYRDLVDITFRNENDFAAENAKKTWRSRAKNKTVHIEHLPRDSLSPTPSSTGSTVSVYFTPEPPMAMDLELCARNRMFFDYTIPMIKSKIQTGIFDYLPDLVSKTNPSSSLHAAMAAVSVANFIRRSDLAVDNSRLLVEQHYGNALRLVSLETQDPIAAKSDGLLVAVLMLGIFEQMSSGGNNPFFLQAHAHGLAALLKLRPVPTILDGHRFRLFTTVNMQMLSACLRQGIPSFTPYSRLQEYYAAPFPMIQLAGIIHQSVDILALWNESTSSSLQADLAELQPLLSQISALDAALATWEFMCSSRARFWICEASVSSHPIWLQRLLVARGAPEVMYQYDSIQELFGWNLYRMVRIALCKTQLTGRTTLLMVDNETVTHCIATIESMVEDICSSLLASFTIPIEGKPKAETIQEVCGFRPYTLILPLTIARTCLQTMATSEKAEARLLWVDEVLTFIMRDIHRSNNPPGW